jgi:hypothetical protein
VSKKSKKSQKSNDASFDGLFEMAAERGIDLPVALIFQPGPRAAAVYAALAGRPVPAGVTAEHPAFLLHSVGDAAGALRAHGGLGGGLVANLLGNPPEPVARWLLYLLDDVIGVFAYTSGSESHLAQTYYDRLPPSWCCPGCVRKRGPGTLVVPVTVGGRETALRLAVPDAPSVDRIAELARIAADRRVDSLGDPETAWGFDVGAAEMATILSSFYADAPALVAEVLRALRRARHPSHRWLRTTLGTAPGLGELAEEVGALTKADPA